MCTWKTGWRNFATQRQLPGSEVTLPYRSIAPFYDRIMSHVDYPAWARHVRALWRKYGNSTPPRRVLELAAGTCRFAAMPIFPKAFAVYSDLSPEMLRVAPGVGTRHAVSPHRVACDARTPALRGPFDLVFMLYDSLNYLLRPADVLRALRAVRKILRPGGLFIFDVTTDGCSRRHFADTCDVEELEGGAYIRRSRYDAGIRLQLNFFAFFLTRSGGNSLRHEETHQQRIYPAARLRTFAQRSGFKVLAVLAGFSFRPGTDRNERLHFVLQRP